MTALTPEAPRGLLAAVGRGPLGLWRELASIVRLGLASLRSLPRLERPEAVRQLFELGNRSLVFVVVVLGFTGTILVIQASLQARRIIGDLSLVGPTFLQLLVREFGPTIVAMMIAARYGAGVAAELGAMQVTEQIDALRMAGEDPPAFLVAPRLVAGVIGTPALVIAGTAAAFAAGGLAAYHGFGVSHAAYYRLSMVAAADVVVGSIKALSFGLAIPLVASQAGLSARGGAAGVGRATTRAVIGASLAVLALDLVIGAAAQLLQGPTAS